MHGLETMLDLRVRQSPAMDLLNLNRDYCWQRFSWPVVFVAPLFAVREFARQAPDLWSGRTGVYRFTGDIDDIRETLAGLGASFDWSLDRAAKLQVTETLTHLEAELEEQTDEDPARKAELLSLLAQAAAFEGDPALQGRLLTETLAVYSQIGNRRGQARSIQGLGDIARVLARYDEAAGRFGQALAVYEQIGNQYNEASCLAARAPRPGHRRLGRRRP